MPSCPTEMGRKTRNDMRPRRPTRLVTGTGRESEIRKEVDDLYAQPTHHAGAQATPAALDHMERKEPPTGTVAHEATSALSGAGMARVCRQRDGG